jgi:hypothetical protein
VPNRNAGPYAVVSLNVLLNLAGTQGETQSMRVICTARRASGSDTERRPTGASLNSRHLRWSIACIYASGHLIRQGAPPKLYKLDGVL